MNLHKEERESLRKVPKMQFRVFNALKDENRTPPNHLLLNPNLNAR